MPIPTYQDVMKPILEFCSDRKEVKLSDVVNILADKYSLTNEEKNLRHNKSKTNVFYGRIHWAKTYLQKAKLLESKNRGCFNITDLGVKTLKENSGRIDNQTLNTINEFRRWKGLDETQSKAKNITSSADDQEQDPEEQMEQAYKLIKQTLKDKLLSKIMEQSPAFFEKLVLDLILALGYGDSEDAGKVLGQSSDGGVDGVIKQDKLGLDLIYLQAKRWENNIGSGEIRNFIGALATKQASKGVFITTSSFTKEAFSTANSASNQTVILIDGDKLTDLMIDHDVAVSKRFTYDIKSLDLDYFVEE